MQVFINHIFSMAAPTFVIDASGQGQLSSCLEIIPFLESFAVLAYSIDTTTPFYRLHPLGKKQLYNQSNNQP